MIDVFDKVKDMLIFESEDDFYYLQILQRKKDNPKLGSNSRVIKNYYIHSIDYLLSKYEEIKGLCTYFNARAMLRLNKRSYRKVSFKTMQNIANSMSNENYRCINNSYDRACGKYHNENKNNKTWIIDIDGDFAVEYLFAIIDDINSLKPDGNKVITQLSTKNGLHLITRPFNLSYFKEKHPFLSVHKDNPINLFIP